MSPVLRRPKKPAQSSMRPDGGMVYARGLGPRGQPCRFESCSGHHRNGTASGFPERESGGFLIPDMVSIMDPNFKPYRTGMVTVLERYPCGKGNRKGGRENVFYYCRCDCGNTFIVSGDELSRHLYSCGCTPKPQKTKGRRASPGGLN